MINGLNILLFSNTLKVRDKYKKIIPKIIPIPKIIYLNPMIITSFHKSTDNKSTDNKSTHHNKDVNKNKKPDWTMEKKKRLKKSSWVK
tara:strand:+ start:80 stop:343 length:264 start_codon:yes stop_codon:yes gene_type:complete